MSKQEYLKYLDDLLIKKKEKKEEKERNCICKSTDKCIKGFQGLIGNPGPTGPPGPGFSSLITQMHKPVFLSISDSTPKQPLVKFGVPIPRSHTALCWGSGKTNIVVNANTTVGPLPLIRHRVTDSLLKSSIIVPRSGTIKDLWLNFETTLNKPNGNSVVTAEIYKNETLISELYATSIINSTTPNVVTVRDTLSASFLVTAGERLAMTIKIINDASPVSGVISVRISVTLLA